MDLRKQLETLTTEKINPAFGSIDQMSTLELATLMNSEDAKVFFTATIKKLTRLFDNLRILLLQKLYGIVERNCYTKVMIPKLYLRFQKQ